LVHVALIQTHSNEASQITLAMTAAPYGAFWLKKLML